MAIDPQETSDEFLHNLSKAVFQALKEILDLPLYPTEPGFEERLQRRFFVADMFSKYLKEARQRKMPNKRVQQAVERAEIVAITAEKVEERRRKIQEKKAKLNGGISGGG